MNSKKVRIIIWTGTGAIVGYVVGSYKVYNSYGMWPRAVTFAFVGLLVGTTIERLQTSTQKKSLIRKGLLGLVFFNVVFALMYTIFWTFYFSVYLEKSVMLDSTVNLVITSIVSVACGFLILKQFGKQTVLESSFVLILIVLGDIFGGLLGFKASPKEEWFGYLFLPVLWVGILFGSWLRMKLSK